MGYGTVSAIVIQWSEVCNPLLSIFPRESIFFTQFDQLAWSAFGVDSDLDRWDCSSTLQFGVGADSIVGLCVSTQLEGLWIEQAVWHLGGAVIWFDDALPEAGIVG